MAGNIRIGEMRPGLFRIQWTLSNEMRKVGIHNNKFQLCGTQSGRNFSITFHLKSMGVENNNYVKDFTVIVDEISCNDDSSSEAKFASNSTSRENQPKRQKLVDLKKLEPEIQRPVYIWINVGSSNDVALPVQLIEKNSIQWQVDCLGKEQPMWCILLRMDFGINTLSKKFVTGLSALFKNQTLCDVQFHLKDKQSVGAHVAILSAGSPVFAAMFQSGFVESTTRKVYITKFEPQIFTHLLFFLYTGSAPKLTEINTILSLLEVANMYAVEALKDECINMLKKQLNTDNAIEMLIWSHDNLIPSPKLFEAAMKFVVNNSRQIFSHPEWMELVKNHPELCVKTNQHMADLLPNTEK